MRTRPRPGERRPQPAPLATDDRGAVLAGLGVWAVVLAVLLVSRDSLGADDRGWWLWTAVAGIGLGLVGLVHLHRRARRHPAPTSAPTPAPTSGSTRGTGPG